MSDSSARYADWKAPADDGAMLIWPEAALLQSQTLDNAKRLSAATAPVQRVPLAEVRRQARAFIHRQGDVPIIATGHQTELYHPGVWVKNVLIDRLAHRLGGAGVHFAVDSDAPKHLHLRWPGGSRPMTDDPRMNTLEVAAWVNGPTPQHLQSVRSEFAEAAAAWGFKPMIDPFFDTLRRTALEGYTKNLPSDLSNAVHAVDWELGLRYFEFVTSPVWTSAPYLAYAHDILARIDQFAGHYNGALADYRRRNGIRTSARPMPDLHVGLDEIEAPFWMDHHASASRSRVFVQREAGALWIESPAGERFDLLATADGWEAAGRLQAWCRGNDLWLAPRALTLTAFFRTFLADQFVHGIGGGRYDQVTDDVIHRHFGIEPPRFSVTTGTLYFPAAAGQRRINLSPLVQEGRRIRHGLLSREKRAMAERIESLPRLSRERKLAAESNSAAVQEWERRLRDAEHESLRQKVLFDRELFFAIQPRERLTAMIERYRASV